MSSKKILRGEFRKAQEENAEMNRRKICHLCLGCGTYHNLVHAGQGKFMCKTCLDTLPKKRLKELEVI